MINDDIYINGVLVPKKKWSGLTNTEMDKDNKDNRDLKKIIFRGEVAYDVSLVPEGYTLQQVLDLYTQTGVLIYNTNSIGISPISLTTKK